MREGNLEFTFPADWEPQDPDRQYDRWPYYKNRFNRCCDGSKAVDIVALDPDRQLWLIEVKDYRFHRRDKEINLWDEMALKVRDTLAGLFAAANHDDHPHHSTARDLLKSRRIRTVLHLEQPSHHSRMFPRMEVGKIQLKLKTLIKSIDAHPVIVDHTKQMPWDVTSLTVARS